MEGISDPQTLATGIASGLGSAYIINALWGAYRAKDKEKDDLSNSSLERMIDIQQKATDKIGELAQTVIALQLETKQAIVEATAERKIANKILKSQTTTLGRLDQSTKDQTVVLETLVSSTKLQTGAILENTKALNSMGKDVKAVLEDYRKVMQGIAS